MIKIVLSMGIAAWEKDNKKYACIRKFNGEKSIYDKKIYILYVTDVAHRFKIENSITSESLEDLNKWLEKIEVEIVED